MRSRHRGLLPAGVAVLLALAVAGCGSSYTKADFIQRANGICLSTTRAVRSLTAPEFTGTPAQQQRSLSVYLGRVAPLVRSEARRLSGLPKPPGKPLEEKLRQRWLASVHESADKLGQFASAAHNGSAKQVAQAGAALAAVPVVQFASQYGAHACANPGATYAHLPSA